MLGFKRKEAPAVEQAQPSPSVKELADAERAARTRLDSARITYGRTLLNHLPDSAQVEAAAVELREAASAHVQAAATLTTATGDAMAKRRAAVLKLCSDRESAAAEVEKYLKAAAGAFAEVQKTDMELMAKQLGREAGYHLGGGLMVAYLRAEFSRVFEPAPHALPSTTLLERIKDGIGVIRRAVQ